MKKVAVIIPVYNEPVAMQADLADKLGKLTKRFRDESDVELLSYFAADAPDVEIVTSSKVLFRNEVNQGMSLTMLRAYQQVIQIHPDVDVVVKMDANEHDSMYLVDIVSGLTADASAMLVPVRQPSPGNTSTELRTNKVMDRLKQAIADRDYDDITKIFDHQLLIGFQAFRGDLLKQMLPLLQKGMKVFEAISGKPSRWYIDLLTIILATHFAGDTVELIFGGYTANFKENRSPEKQATQMMEGQTMLITAKAILS